MSAPPRAARRATERPSTPEPRVLRLSPLNYIAVLMVLLIAVVCTGVSLYLAWTFLVPILLILWIRRVRTEISLNEITAVGILGTTRMRWDEVNGLRFPKLGSVRADRTDGTSVRLPAVTFRDLPLISEASGGRIPDPYAAEAAAARAAEEDIESSPKPSAPED